MSDLDAVKQATKYATPMVELQRPADLAEFVAHSRGRRWNEGSGVLRGYMAAAAAEDDAAADDAAEAARPEVAELGPRLTLWGPLAPALDLVAPGYGWRSAGRRPRPEAGAPVLLRLAARWAQHEEALAVLDGLGERVTGPRGLGWAVDRAVLACMLGRAAEGPDVARGALRLPTSSRGLPPPR
jgi:hypothetical protein